MLVVGTSAEVFPASEIPNVARAAGAAVVEVNPEPTRLTHVADLTAHAIDLAGGSRRAVPRLDEKAWETIGLPATIVPSIAGEAEQQTAEVERFILWDGD